jgi:hypothetical protein
MAIGFEGVAEFGEWNSQRAPQARALGRHFEVDQYAPHALAATRRRNVGFDL